MLATATVAGWAPTPPLGARTAQVPATPLRTPAGLPPQITVAAYAATLIAPPSTPLRSLLAPMTASTPANRSHPPTLRAPAIQLPPATPGVQWTPAATRAPTGLQLNTTAAAPANLVPARIAPQAYPNRNPPLQAVGRFRLSLEEANIRFFEAEVTFKLQLAEPMRFCHEPAEPKPTRRSQQFGAGLQLVEARLNREQDAARMALIKTMGAWESGFNEAHALFFNRYGGEPFLHIHRTSFGEKWDEYKTKGPVYKHIVVTIRRLELLNSDHDVDRKLDTLYGNLMGV